MTQRVAFDGPGIALVLVLFMLPANVAGQDRRFHVSIGGGGTPVFDTLGDGFAAGWGPTLGIAWDVSDYATLQFDYDYRQFQLKTDLDRAAGTYDANHNLHQLALGLVVALPPRAAVRPYLVTGPGFYHRSVEVTEYVGTGIICDPWIYLCGAYPIEEVLGSRGGWDLGFHVGGGVRLQFSEEGEIFFETRYHYVWGPETQPPVTPFQSRGPQRVNGRYWPIALGVRF